jgi:flagellin
MRAQISGLDQAQSNVKDGISLVKTGEGALQEVQDMLNRMVTLATQSSNGTYDDSVDRANLQKEVTALKDEINRIADSSNFNGISLLDGSLEDGANLTTSGNMTVGAELPAVGATLGTDTVLHNTNAGGTGTSFDVELHDVGFSDNAGDTLTINFGGSDIAIKGINKAGNGGATPAATSTGDAADDQIGAEDIVDRFLDTTQINAGKVSGVKVNGTDIQATINGQLFNVTKSASGTGLHFEQVSAPTSKTEEVNGSMSVKVTGGILDGSAASSTVVDTPAVAQKYSLGVTVTGTDWDDGDTITVDGQTLTVGTEITKAEMNGGTAGESVAAAIAAKITATGYTVSADGANLVFTATTGGTDGGNGGNGPAKITAGTYAATSNNAAQAGAGTNNSTVTVSGALTIVDAGAEEVNHQAVTGNALVDYNVSTTNINNVTAGGSSRLASTSFKLTNDMVADGASVTIGDDTFTFTTDASKVGTTGYVDATSGNLDTIAKKLTEAAAGNDVYTVGHDGSKITLTETVTHANATDYGDDGYDLSTADGISKSLGYSAAPAAGKALTLQIGDTAESYNQMNVSIEDIHTKSLGIDDVDISTQEGATDAIQKIKDAINQVSSTRGTLGAIQNRLEHTSNNLSVMSENIQDAESTIRDTDMADEMMSYTKNNILVQAAQAMLAQANSVPQGVLQLLG